MNLNTTAGALHRWLFYDIPIKSRLRHTTNLKLTDTFVWIPPLIQKL